MQHLTFCSVGANQKNGVFGQIIKDLTLSLCTLVICDQYYWPEFITTMLWSFSLVVSADRLNNIHVDMNDKTTEMKFSDTIGSTNRLSNFHTFGCPVYILDAHLQIVGGGCPPKWDP